jgi:hypothetical protein
MDLDDLVGTLEPPETALEVTDRKPKRVLRRRHVPTEQDRLDVATWVCAGIPQTSMAQLLRIDEATLRRNYRDELTNGVGVANGTVVGKLMGQVMAGNVTAMIFWCKTRMGWREKNPYDADNPLVIQQNVNGPVDPKTLARELRDAILEIARPQLP